MTNKEAINIMSQMIKDEEGFLSDNTVEAHKMAIKALDQEPCEMTAEEYRQRMIQAFHNADCDELIAICVLPTEKEFEHLEWLLKNHYKNEPCGDAIDRKLVSAFIDGLISDDGEREKGLEYISNMPLVNPQPKTGHWIPVSEGLPEIHNCIESYLVTLKHGGIHVAMFTECKGKHWWTYDDVVAWMPLPEPYKAESESKE